MANYDSVIIVGTLGASLIFW